MRHLAPIWLLLLLAGCGAAPAPSAPRYFLVGPAGARDTQGVELKPGFGLLIGNERTERGVRLGRSKNGHWVPLDALQPATPSGFSGVALNGALDLAWTVDKGVPMFSAPSEKSTRRLLPRHALIRPLTDEPSAPGWLRVGKEWLRASDLAALRRPVTSPRPAVVGPTERWIDVDLASSTLVAYEGDRPVFATLVSAGIGRPGSPIATPPGVHRIFAKLPSSDMSNFGHTGVVPYDYEAVPNVQYFSGSVALHGALWHDRFGVPASHGCVNLAPADAERLFGFTADHSVVRVR